MTGFTIEQMQARALARKNQEKEDQLKRAIQNLRNRIKEKDRYIREMEQYIQKKYSHDDRPKPGWIQQMF